MFHLNFLKSAYFFFPSHTLLFSFIHFHNNIRVKALQFFFFFWGGFFLSFIDSNKQAVIYKAKALKQIQINSNPVCGLNK